MFSAVPFIFGDLRLTFSMVARCPKTQALGVVEATGSIATGSVVPHAEEGIGAIATQATTNVIHGINGLRLLKIGFDPKRVLQSTLVLDPDPRFRQILIIDSQGRTAAHTGSKTRDWKGHIIGENYVAGANSIRDPNGYSLPGHELVEAMIKTFEKLQENRPLHERLLLAIESGGEVAREIGYVHKASALVVVGIEEEFRLFTRPFLNLRVDSSDHPIKDLRRVYESYLDMIVKRRQQPVHMRGFE